MKLNKAISDRILALLFERNLTISQLSELSGMSNSSLNNIIYRNCKSCTLNSIHKICTGLNVPLEEFFTGEVFKKDDIEV